MVHTAFGDTTSTAATAATEPAGEARPAGTTGYCTTTKSEFAVSFDESGPWSRAKGTPSAAATTAVKSVGGDRPPGGTKNSATTPDEAESPDMRAVMAERRRVIRGVLSGKLDLVRRRLVLPHGVLARGRTRLFLRFGVRDPRENLGRRPKDREISCTTNATNFTRSCDARKPTMSEG